MKDKKRKEKKRQRGRSVQELMGIYGFTRYGLATTAGELLFFRVSPVNISVLSASNIDVKIHNLQTALTVMPDLEIVCTDSCECFDANVPSPAGAGGAQRLCPAASASGWRDADRAAGGDVHCPAVRVPAPLLWLEA